jgi:hypothetical protein
LPQAFTFRAVGALTFKTRFIQFRKVSQDDFFLVVTPGSDFRPLIAWRTVQTQPVPQNINV